MGRQDSRTDRRIRALACSLSPPSRHLLTWFQLPRRPLEKRLERLEWFVMAERQVANVVAARRQFARRAPAASARLPRGRRRAACSDSACRHASDAALSPRNRTPWPSTAMLSGIGMNWCGRLGSKNAGTCHINVPLQPRRLTIARAAVGCSVRQPFGSRSKADTRNPLRATSHSRRSPRTVGRPPAAPMAAPPPVPNLARWRRA